MGGELISMFFCLRERVREGKRKKTKRTQNGRELGGWTDFIERSPTAEILRARPLSTVPFLRLPMRRVYCHYSADKSGDSSSSRQIGEHRIKISYGTP